MNNFLENFDEESKRMLDETVDAVSENAEYFTNISDTIVKYYMESFDNLFKRIYADVVEKEATDNQLEKYTLELSNAIYFIGDKLESVGIKDDLSKLASKEIYNNSYLEHIAVEGKKPTVAELTAMAETDSKYETILNSIYSRAYKQIKYKVDAGYEMLNSLRKIISKRMKEQELSMLNGSSSLKILNETM